jgi:hypothetical protein
VASDDWLEQVALEGGRAVWDDDGRHRDRPTRMVRAGEQRCPELHWQTREAACSFPAGHPGRHAALQSQLGDHQVIDISM